MEETREQQKLHGFLQCTIYVMVALEATIFIYQDAPIWGIFHVLILKLSTLPVYKSVLYSKLSILLVICLVSIGTLSKKEKDLDPQKHILFPLVIGLSLFFGSLYLFYRPPGAFAFVLTTWNALGYMACSFLGALFTSMGMDNVSKIIRSGLGKDVWNVEGESFMQPTELVTTPYSVNIPMKFYYRKKVHEGWININNPFRGSILIGTPGSGKSFGIVNPFIRQMIAKEFCVCVYDYKYPDLGKIAYYHYLLAKQEGKCKTHQFHVINLTDVERSRRINVWRSDYISTLAEASESAEGLVEALKKGDSSGGSTSSLRNLQ